MTTLALAAPTTAISLGPASGAITGVILPASETSLATFAGFSVPNNGAVLVHVVVGVSGAGNLAFICQKTIFGGSIPSTVFQIALVASTSYLFGPFSPSNFNDANGLLQATISVVTGNSVGVYQLPGALT